MTTKSFPFLLHGLKRQHHAGILLAMAAHTRISYTTLWRWERGFSLDYDRAIIKRLCAIYTLEPPTVWTLIDEDRARTERGIPVPLPDLSDVRRGPVRGAGGARRHRRKPHPPDEDSGPRRGWTRLLPDPWGLIAGMTHYVKLESDARGEGETAFPSSRVELLAA